MDKDGKPHSFNFGKGDRDKFIKFSLVHEGVHYLRNQHKQFETKPMLRDCAVELHRVDPKEGGATHSLSAKEVYDEEVQVNSIAAVALFGGAEKEVPQGVLSDARGLGLLK